MRGRNAIGRVCVITDTVVQSRFGHVELAALACDGGADMIQLRDKAIPDDDMIALGREIRRICQRHGALLIVNDRVEVARACGADGVHLGRSDVSIAHARRALGDDAIVGATAHALDEALAADASDADYLGFGHVFATSSKHKATPPVGVNELRRACAAVARPVLAIGGITSANAADVMRAGAWGVAVIAAVCAADDPRAAAGRLRDAIAEQVRTG